mgnify:CR=1 FL=1
MRAFEVLAIRHHVFQNHFFARLLETCRCTLSMYARYRVSAVIDWNGFYQPIKFSRVSPFVSLAAPRQMKEMHAQRRHLAAMEYASRTRRTTTNPYSRNVQRSCADVDHKQTAFRSMR